MDAAVAAAAEQTVEAEVTGDDDDELTPRTPGLPRPEVVRFGGNVNDGQNVCKPSAVAAVARARASNIFPENPSSSLPSPAV